VNRNKKRPGGSAPPEPARGATLRPPESGQPESTPPTMDAAPLSGGGQEGRGGAESDSQSLPAGDAAKRIKSRSRRSFLLGGVAALAGLGSIRWLATRREDDGIAWPLRRTLEINEQLARDFFRPSRLAPEFPARSAQEPRVNGSEGMDDDDFDPAKWRLRVKGLADDSDDLDDTYGDASSDGEAGNSQPTAGEASLAIGDIMALPRVEMVTELKCIEGWSVPVHWAGARFADFAQRYKPATRDGSVPDVQNKPEALVPYVSLETPDGDYYVGLDLASALHPQTLLCYEMNGEPLTLEHGAPLRLVIPVKYGIKNIKRIGMIHFTSRRPADYWAERGYDWYAGH